MNTTFIQSRPSAGGAGSSANSAGSAGLAEGKRELVLRWSLEAGRLGSRWHSVPAVPAFSRPNSASAGTGVGTSGGPGGR